MAGLAVTGSAAVAQPPPFALYQNDPEPFCPASQPTRIDFAVQTRSHVQLIARNASSMVVVRSLVDAELQPGFFTVIWDGRDDGGMLVPEGTYPYTMSARIGDVQVFEATRTASVECVVAVEKATWARIKALYARP